MGTDQAIDIVREALTVTLILSTPILGAGLVIGLAVSVLQAVTQVQDQTISLWTFTHARLKMGICGSSYAKKFVLLLAHRIFNSCELQRSRACSRKRCATGRGTLSCPTFVVGST